MRVFDYQFSIARLAGFALHLINKPTRNRNRYDQTNIRLHRFCRCLFTRHFRTKIKAVKSEAKRRDSKNAAEISAKRIEATIRKLVSFGTRNTLSEQNNPTRGIGAARDWIFAEFQKISADCGNCLTVEKQTFLQPKANRVPEPTNLTNVVATLKRHDQSRDEFMSFPAITIRCALRRRTRNATRPARTTTLPARRRSSKWRA